VRHELPTGLTVSLDNVKAVVLAAGKGVRMKSDRPKVLHQVLGRPVLDYVLRHLRQAGVSDIIVVVGHQADRVRAAAPGCRFIEQKEQKGTGHALLQAEAALEGFAGDLFVVAGDAPLVGPNTLQRVLEDHRAQGREATFLSACLDDPTGYGRVVREKESRRFLRFAEETDATPEEKDIPECNSGEYVFRCPGIFEALRGVKPNNKKGELYLTDEAALLVIRPDTFVRAGQSSATILEGPFTRSLLKAQEIAVGMGARTLSAYIPYDAYQISVAKRLGFRRSRWGIHALVFEKRI